MLTEEQQNVVDTSKILTEDKLLTVQACAGSGKTSTLVEVAKASPDKKFLYLAFNKAIVEEARQKFPENVEICTTHSLAYRWFSRHYGKNLLKNLKSTYKVFDLKKIFPDADYVQLGSIITNFRNFCMSDAKVPYDQEIQLILQEIKQGTIPLTHDGYLKIYELEALNKFQGYDYILLDEAQDTNDVTLSLFRNNQCRQILVGDPHQSIYAFRGALNAFDKVNADYNLHLSYSFRSRQEILDQANYFLGKLAKDKDSLVPMKSKVENNKKPESFAEIMRTNAEIISRIAILTGREEREFKLVRPAEAIFSCALSLLNIMLKQKDQVSPEYKWLTRFKDLKAIEGYASECGDAEILANLKHVFNYGPELFDLFRIGQKLYKHQDATKALCSAHTAKGLEWDHVRLHYDFPDLFKEQDRMQNEKQEGKKDLKAQKRKVLTPDEFEQELNLYYVAVTRARYKLADESANFKKYQQEKKHL